MSSLQRSRANRDPANSADFLPLTAELVARIEAIVAAGIALLDEIEGDADFEPSLPGTNHRYPVDAEDDEIPEEDGDEHEPQFGASADVNQVAGWFTVGTRGSDGCEEECEDEGAQADDEGFVESDYEMTAPETSCGFGAAIASMPFGAAAVRLREAFDPRLARRGDRRLHAGAPRHLPTFPHEPADRAGFDKWAEREEIEEFIRHARGRGALVAAAGADQRRGGR